MLPVKTTKHIDKTERQMNNNRKAMTLNWYYSEQKVTATATLNFTFRSQKTKFRVFDSLLAVILCLFY